MTTISLASVQSLLIEMQFSGQKLSTGTAFVVPTPRGPHLITNRHNVTGRNQDTNEPLSKTGGTPDSIVILHNKKGQLGQWIPCKEALFSNGVRRWIEHPTLGSKADFVALPLTDLNNVDLYPYNTSNTGPDIRMAPADVVSVIGFPFGRAAGRVFGVWATGFLASEPDIDYSNLPIQLIDCRSRPGQSGSPVIAFRNSGTICMKDGSASVFSGAPLIKFIGIYSGRINAESDLGIVWKASAIDQLVNDLAGINFPICHPNPFALSLSKTW